MKYILRKTGALLATVLIISLLAFLAFQVIPGDPTTKMLGSDATPERVAALRAQLGLDRSIAVRYFEWLKGFVVGDMGTSYSYSISVNDLLGNKVVVTASLSALAFLMVIGISIPVGIAMARWSGKWIEKVFQVLNQITMAVPSFLIGIIFNYVLGLVLRLFTPGEFISYNESFWGFLGYLVFPALAIALPKSAMVIKLLCSSIMKEMRQDYVRTAYSRGNSRWETLSIHVLRNAIMPVITFMASTLSSIVAGSIIIEQVFSIPGIGRLLLLSISNRDFPVVQAIVVMIAFLVVFVNFIADILYQCIDPRVRLA